LKIQIKRINSGEEVVVKTSVGLLAGTWQTSKYDSIQPIGSVWYAEININTKWEELTKTRLQDIKSCKYKVNVINDKVVFRGMIDGVEEDKVCFRLTEACLIMICADSPPSCLKNEWYELLVDISSVEIWPFDCQM
jgi:hypothetical protein